MSLRHTLVINMQHVGSYTFITCAALTGAIAKYAGLGWVKKSENNRTISLTYFLLVYPTPTLPLPLWLFPTPQLKGRWKGKEGPKKSPHWISIPFPFFSMFD